jgi:hypothetical protein
MPDPVTDPQNGGGQSEGGAMPQTITLDGANWNQFIPDDLKDDLNFKPFEGKSVDEVLRSFVNAQRMIGADKVIVPAGKNDTPEVWAQVWDKLGRPKDVSGYAFTDPTLPEGMTMDTEFVDSFKKFAHENGLSQKQAAGLFDFYNKWAGEKFQAFQQSVQQGSQKAMEAAEQTLRKEFGAKYDDKVMLAKKVILTYGGTPEETKSFIERFGNDPTVIKTLVRIGELVSENKLLSGDKADWDLGPEGARKKAVDIMSNETNPLYKPYHSKNHPQHQEALDQVERYFQAAAGGK